MEMMNSDLHRIRLLTADEVAEILRVSRASVYRWAEQGALPAIKVGRSVRFDPQIVKHLTEHGLAHKAG